MIGPDFLKKAFGIHIRDPIKLSLPRPFLARNLLVVGLLNHFLMMRTLLVLICTGLSLVGMAQLKPTVKCPDFYVDILNGTVNGLTPGNTAGEVRTKFPCLTGSQDEMAACGTEVMYKDRDVYFFTQRKYIEIGPKFRGKMSLPLIGTKRGSLFSKLGSPKLKDPTWDAFETQYGTLVLHYDAAGKVKLIQFSPLSTDQMSLCE
jgi:hypothetical protein